MTTLHHLLTPDRRGSSDWGGRGVWVRADSAFCTAATVGSVLRAGAWFSITARAWKSVNRAIAAIGEEAWTPIRYPHAVWDDQAEQWISEAEVAETGFVAFTSHPKAEQVACRLVVRRVKRLNTVEGQDELVPGWRYHAFGTNAPFDAVTTDRYHRGHAIIEQVNAGLKGGPLAHLPSAGSPRTRPGSPWP